MITVREAAEQWKISQRQVQRYCAQGRIQGAVKQGGRWHLPADALCPDAPPPDMRQDSAPKDSCWGLMPLMNTAFEPGQCQQAVDQMPAGPLRIIAQAEYDYFSGRAEQTVRQVELLLDSPEPAVQLSAFLLYAYANLTLGQIHRVRYALSALRGKLSHNAPDAPPQLQAARSAVAATAAVLLHLPIPEELPPVQQYLPLLPPGMRLFALYVLAHQAYLQQDYGRSLGIVETAFMLQTEVYPIPSIYLHLVAVMDYMALKQPDPAQQHLLAAWQMARPDDLIEGFGEHHGLLGGMLEAVIKKDWPEDFKRIISITYRFSAGWRRVHNPITGHTVADNLTTSEFATAMLAARGWTNQEIASHLGISSNTVKQYISATLQKLGIRHRKDLKQYLLS